MTTIKTKDIDFAITELRKKTCIRFDGSNARWGDQELFRIIQCLNDGCGIHLQEILLQGNNFSQSAINVLCAIIGPTARPAIAAARGVQKKNEKTVNPQ